MTEDMIRVSIMGREYKVPRGLTIVKAMEFLGHRFIRGVGCRGGYCGACATVYRTEKDYRLKFALACQTSVEDGMYLTIIPFTPAEKVLYKLNELKASHTVLTEYYPEITKCVCCNTCSKACPQELEVMDYVQAAVRGDLARVAELSFDCIQCGLCAMRCPVGIVPYNMAQLARRIYARYISTPSYETENRIKDIEVGKFKTELFKLTKLNLRELKDLYTKREMKV